MTTKQLTVLLIATVFVLRVIDIILSPPHTMGRWIEYIAVTLLLVWSLWSVWTDRVLNLSRPATVRRNVMAVVVIGVVLVTFGYMFHDYARTAGALWIGAWSACVVFALATLARQRDA